MAMRRTLGLLMVSMGARLVGARPLGPHASTVKPTSPCPCGCSNHASGKCTKNLAVTISLSITRGNGWPTEWLWLHLLNYLPMTTISPCSTRISCFVDGPTSSFKLMVNHRSLNRLMVKMEIRIKYMRVQTKIFAWILYLINFFIFPLEIRSLSQSYPYMTWFLLLQFFTIFFNFCIYISKNVIF